MPTFRITPILTALALVSLPVFAPAQTNPAPAPTFDVTSVRQNKTDPPRWSISFTADGFSARDGVLEEVIHEAYGSDPNQQWADAPAWIKETRFDIEAKFDISADPHVTIDQRRAMLQALLADRFKLKIHHEQRDSPLYDLVVIKGGLKATIAQPDDTHVSVVYGPMCLIDGRGGSLTMKGCSMGDLALYLSTAQAQGPPPRRTVVDKTGLTDRWTFQLHWMRTPLEPDAAEPSNAGPSIETALQEQLGLKLIPTHGPLDVIVIDHAEMPSEN